MWMALRNNSIEPKIMVSSEITKDSKHDKYVDGRILMLLSYRRYPVSFFQNNCVIFRYFVTFCYILSTLCILSSIFLSRYPKFEIIDMFLKEVIGKFSWRHMNLCKSVINLTVLTFKYKYLHTSTFKEKMLCWLLVQNKL